MNPLHKPEEGTLLELFRRVWADAEQITRAEISDAPDDRGELVGGRPFGMEIATLTENWRAQTDRILHGSFTRELEAACAAEVIHASFGLNLQGWQADGFLNKANRALVVALLVRLAKEAGGQPLVSMSYLPGWARWSAGRRCRNAGFHRYSPTR